MYRCHRLLAVLGIALVLGAIGKAVTTTAAGGPPLEAGLDVVLLSAPGFVLLYVSVWLPGTDVEPDHHPRLVAWVVGGVAVMAGFIGLRVLHPGVSVEFAFGTTAASLAIGSVAGLAIGVHEAQAITRAHALERQNAELKRAAAVERKNDELREAQEQLECAIGKLEASNERLEEFAYAASHDLQEPLRMVSSYLQLIERRYGAELDDDGLEFLDYAVDGADRMREMIDGLLEYSRVSTRGDPFDPVDLEAVCDDVLTDLQFRIEETDATVTRESLPTVEGDGRQLRQLLQNLIDNALEYSGDDPPRVFVSAAREGSAWVISVRDDGVGIDPSDADRVFTLFERLHAVDEGAGSGIGLALCKRIAERHGGTIRVDSEPGEGSTFSVTIPQNPPRQPLSSVVRGERASMS